MEKTQPAYSLDNLQSIVERYWGYTSLRPLQEQAMLSVLDGRDSLVVLPTGGGKSLCYQAPAMLRGDTTVVVSPLISLMKDQVDALKACGVPAVSIDSCQTPGDRAAAERSVAQGNIRLLFVSPERLANEDFQRLLQSVNVHTFAIDEAHCISQWGHDFRPDYRQLSKIKQLFPFASVHAYTATATVSVREDIVRQLELDDPVVLVGNFDRANLTYRVLFRRDELAQVINVVKRHPQEAGIIYCISRRAVDELSRSLQKNGLQAVAYHAGLTAEQRRDAQEAFAEERCDLMVATVAFGMGIDRSNVRFVLHTGMPKSLEHYQQETGRAGRDGLEAECVLLYSNADVLLWRSIMEKSAGELPAGRGGFPASTESFAAAGGAGFAVPPDTVAAGADRFYTAPPEAVPANAAAGLSVPPSNMVPADVKFLETAFKHLDEMSRYCRGAVCRHRALVEHFGQSYPGDRCGACDICLGETKEVDDAGTIARKILSCIARVKRPFGIGHIISVLRGENTEAVRRWQHEQLSTYGLMREYDKGDLRDWIDQLIGQGFLLRSELELSNGHHAAVVALNSESLRVLRNQCEVKLLKPMRPPKQASGKRTAPQATLWNADADGELFEILRVLRRRLAKERGWQPYMVFSDATLREMSAVKPSRPEVMLRVKGVGATKLQDFGPAFMTEIANYCHARGLPSDAPGAVYLPPGIRSSNHQERI